MFCIEILLNFEYFQQKYTLYAFSFTKMICSSYGEISMNSAGSIQTQPPVTKPQLHTNNEVGVIKNRDCILVEDKLVLENSNISQDKATPGQTDKIRLLKALFCLLGPLLVCSSLAIAISWVMIFPASIVLVAFVGIELYLERNDPKRSHHHA